MVSVLIYVLFLFVSSASLILGFLQELSSGRMEIKKCKHGDFLLSRDDLLVSRHLSMYGEWAEPELQLFLGIVRPGDIVIDAGANIGAFTVPLARAVGIHGRVHAFEPQRIIFQRLTANIAINNLQNVHTYNAALGKESSFLEVPLINYSFAGNFAAVSFFDPSLFKGKGSTESVPLMTLDSIDFMHGVTGKSCPSFIKMDVELLEHSVLLGSRALLKRCRSILYLENPCVGTSGPLVALLYELEYVPYWDVHPTRNSAGIGIEIADEPNDYAINMVCVPSSRLHDSATSSSSQGVNDVSMIGYTKVEPDRPYLGQYFDGKYRQSADCSGGTSYDG